MLNNNTQSNQIEKISQKLGEKVDEMGSVAGNGVSGVGLLEDIVDTKVPQLKVGDEIINHNYFFEYFGGIMQAGNEKNPETQLYNRCVNMYDWLKSVAQRSRQGDHAASVFGFNGSSYKFYENAIVQLAELAQDYGLSSLDVKISPKGNFEIGEAFKTKSRKNLVDTLDKLDEVYRTVEKKGSPSFRFRFLNKPATLIEFYRKVCDTQQEVTITVGQYPTTFSYNDCYFIQLDAKNTHLVLDDYVIGNCDESAKDKAKIFKADLIKQAKQIQYTLHVMGIESKLISGGGDFISEMHNRPPSIYTIRAATA